MAKRLLLDHSHIAAKKRPTTMSPFQQTLALHYADLIQEVDAIFGPSTPDLDWHWKRDWKYFSLVQTKDYPRVSIMLHKPYKKLFGLLAKDIDWVTLFDYKARTEDKEVYCPKKGAKIVEKFMKGLNKLCKNISKLEKSQTT